MLEFVIAFFPILLLFLCCLEIARFAVGRIMIQRAAGIAARACAVIKDQPAHCDNNAVELNNHQPPAQYPGEDGEVTLAAEEALRPFTKHAIRVDNVTCTVPHDADGGIHDNGSGTAIHPKVAQSGTDTVTVKGTFFCAVPLARDLLCPGGGNTHAMTATAKYGHQGARFDCWYSGPLRGLDGNLTGPPFFARTPFIPPFAPIGPF
jgi:hypothetical protein